MTETTKPGLRGEHGISRKATVQGMPDCFGEPVVTNSYAFSSAYEAAGALGTRYSLRPLLCKALKFSGSPDVILAAGSTIRALIRGSPPVTCLSQSKTRQVPDFPTAKIPYLSRSVRCAAPCCRCPPACLHLLPAPRSRTTRRPTTLSCSCPTVCAR